VVSQVLGLWGIGREGLQFQNVQTRACTVLLRATVAASCSRLNLQRSHTRPTSRTDWSSWVLTATPRPQVEASVA